MNRQHLPIAADTPPPEDDLFGWKAIIHWVGFVLRAPLRHKTLAACSFAFVFVLAGAALAAVPYRYAVQATLLAGYPQASALAGSGERALDAPTRAAREVLLRRENLRSIIETTGFVDLHLETRPWAVRLKDRIFDVIRGEPRTRHDLEEGLLDTLESRLWVEVRHEGTLAIGFEWWDAEVARQIVDAAQRSFLAARRASEIGAIGEAVEILEAQRQRLDADLQVSIAAYEKKHDQLRTEATPRPRAPRRGPVHDPELERLRTDVATKRRALTELEGFRRERTAHLQAELAQQQTVYAADHPAIAGTRRLLGALSERAPRAAELEREISEMEAEIARRAGLSANQAMPSAPYLEARLQLEPEEPRLDFERGQVENLLRQHADLRERIQTMRVQQELAEAAFAYRYSVVSPAKLPRGPVKPYPMMFLVGGLLGGLAFGFFAAAAADVRSGKILERWQVEEQFQLPILVELEK